DVTIVKTVAPVVLADGKSVRYAITGAFAASGAVTATFTHGTWSVLPVTGSSSVDPAAAPETVTLGSVEDPTETFIVPGVAIDVPFPVLAGYRLAAASIARAVFTLSGPGLGTVQIDPTIAPVVLGDGTTVRYRITGTFNQTGDVFATFTRGTWSIVDPV